MNILMLGDIVGDKGCTYVRSHLPALKKLYNISFVVANGENSADGNGISNHSLNELYDAGVDVVTTGNHCLRRHDSFDLFDQSPYLLRPANLTSAAPGRGMCVVDFGPTSVAVINLLGTVFMDSLESPFETADRMIDEAKEAGAKIIIVDFHAEATSEKRAMGLYLDGRISALAGTHTHVQTNDLHIQENGTGYITDLGMTGPHNSVIGVKYELALRRIKDKLPARFDNASDQRYFLNGAVFTVDDKTGRATECFFANITD